MTVVISLFSFSQSFSQSRKYEKAQAMRVAIFTDVLPLSADEAKVFWPIYNEYQKEIKALKKSYDDKMKSFKESGEISEEKANEILTVYFDKKQKQLDLEKKYMKKMESAIPTTKIIRIPKAEKRFKKALLEEIKNNRTKAGKK
jgi:hypothetical protein